MAMAKSGMTSMKPVTIAVPTWIGCLERMKQCHWMMPRFPSSQPVYRSEGINPTINIKEERSSQ